MEAQPVEYIPMHVDYLFLQKWYIFWWQTIYYVSLQLGCM